MYKSIKHYSDKVFGLLLILFGITMALGISYGSAVICCRILLPSTINIDSILYGIPFLIKVFYAIITLGLLSGTFGGLYFAYMIFKIGTDPNSN